MEIKTIVLKDYMFSMILKFQIAKIYCVVDVIEAEREYREQGWWIDELLEEFWQCQWREEKWKEVDNKDQGPCLGCQSRKIECVQE